jgi:hypothetical protein
MDAFILVAMEPGPSVDEDGRDMLLLLVSAENTVNGAIGGEQIILGHFRAAAMAGT